jgi:hypothetical protein
MRGGLLLRQQGLEQAGVEFVLGRELVRGHVVQQAVLELAGFGLVLDGGRSMVQMSIEPLPTLVSARTPSLWLRSKLSIIWTRGR